MAEFNTQTDVTRPLHRIASAGVLLGLVLTAAPAHAQATPTAAIQEPCARRDTFPRPAVNGPFDYRLGGGNLGMVESNHFSPEIENLVRGRTGTLAQELSFVLHGFPNHHRALASVSRYALRERSPTPGQLDYTVDCYFARALRFRPDDHIVAMLYADFLTKSRRGGEAVQQLDGVSQSPAANNPLTSYNLGLLYLEAGRPELALTMAHRAMAQGNPRTGLADALRAKGQWKDPAAGDGLTTHSKAASAP